MSIAEEIQSLSPSTVVELFVLDSTALSGGGLMHFHAGTNQLSSSVYWQGIEYIPLPIEAEGFDLSTQGTLPRPKIRVANVDGLLSAAVKASDDLIGAIVIRKRTFAKYLDAVNFPGGVNPEANPVQEFTDDEWYVEQKLSETRYVIEWELVSATDLEGVTLPSRQVIQNTCWWGYRSPECGYTGIPFDANDVPCATAQDFCAKRFNSCRVRHPSGVPVPFGAFPGSTRNG